jgi:hypothetical protein
MNRILLAVLAATLFTVASIAGYTYATRSADGDATEAIARVRNVGYQVVGEPADKPSEYRREWSDLYRQSQAGETAAVASVGWVLTTPLYYEQTTGLRPDSTLGIRYLNAAARQGSAVASLKLHQLGIRIHAPLDSLFRAAMDEGLSPLFLSETQELILMPEALGSCSWTYFELANSLTPILESVYRNSHPRNERSPGREHISWYYKGKWDALCSPTAP